MLNPRRAGGNYIPCGRCRYLEHRHTGGVTPTNVSVHALDPGGDVGKRPSASTQGLNEDRGRRGQLDDDFKPPAEVNMASAVLQRQDYVGTTSLQTLINMDVARPLPLTVFSPFILIAVAQMRRTFVGPPRRAAAAFNQLLSKVVRWKSSLPAQIIVALRTRPGGPQTLTCVFE